MSVLQRAGIRALQTMRPLTDDDLHAWVKAILGVDIPRVATCPGHVAPFTAFADAYFARSPVAVWKASRGFGGKTFLLALLALTEQITLGASVSLLGGSGEQSQRVHSYLAGTDPNSLGKFWNAPLAPRFLLATDPTKREVRTINGGQVRALMASQTSVRGPHPQRLRLDEIDEMDVRIFDAALGQPMSGRGVPSQVVASSTHHNPDGTMTEAIRRAHENGWPVYEWCYRESLEPRGWLSFSEVERKRRTVPKSMWAAEYELQEPSPEGRAIDSDAVEALFDRSLGEFEGAPGEEIRILEPSDAVSFYHGTDWARDKDWTILHTMAEREGQPDMMAAWVRMGRKPWPLMIAAHNKRVLEYGGESMHDATGVGEVCDDYLEVDSMGFDFRKRKERAEMLSNYVAAIENGELVYPMIAWAYREHKYLTNDELYGSKHLPDSVSAAALARKAQQEARYRPSIRSL